jgi:hypothetical protein
MFLMIIANAVHTKVKLNKLTTVNPDNKS